MASQSSAHRTAQQHPRTSDLLLICDDELRCQSASPATLPMLGRWPDTMPGQPIGPLIHPDDMAAVRRLIEEPGGHRLTLDVRLRGHDGHWVRMAATRLARAMNGPGVLGFAAREVDDRIRLEEWVVTERLVTDQVLSMASDAIVSTDRDGKLVGWNRGAETMFGWSREEVIGREVTEVTTAPENRDEYRAGMRELWATGGARVDEPVETTLMRRDGQPVLVELTAWAVQVGETWRFTSLIRDVTARKEVERALTEARENADEAARVKSELMATVSHEIRTPMNGVIGLADILLGTNLDPTQRRYTEGIRTAGSALLGVINDILDFAKAEAGKIVLDESAFNLRDLIEDVADVMAGPARAKGLELVAYVPPDVPVDLVGDPGRLRQVLLNLCGNAVKFTARGEVAVTATRLPTTVDGAGGDGEVRIEVTDTGIGIRAEDQERMFQAFSQADASTTRQYGGTGLGLAICLRIVQALRGRIGVESAAGQGSTFWIELPVRTQAGPPSSEIATLDLRGLRVLVVDDNATNRVVLDSQLREWQLVPTAVESGEAALAVLRDADREHTPFDVAILDMAMPTMDGVDLAQRIGADPAITTPHLIVLTSGLDVDPAAARAAGVSAWLTKPVRRSQLFDDLAQVLARTEAVPADHADPGPARRGHLLLAEDNDINRLVALGILNAIGFTADVAEDGAQALDRLAERDYDGVLMDCQMPVMDGYTATAELRRRETDGRRTPVIALTASARWEDRDRCLQAGMDDFVSKPVDQHSLNDILNQWIPTTPTAPVSRDETVVEDAITERLRTVRGPDEQGTPLVRRIVASYLDHTPGDLDELDRAWRQADPDRVASAAHRLKGSAANVGAVRLAQRLADVEAAGRDARVGGELPREVREEYASASAVLRQELHSTKGGA